MKQKKKKKHMDNRNMNKIPANIISIPESDNFRIFLDSGKPVHKISLNHIKNIFTKKHPSHLIQAKPNK